MLNLDTHILLFALAGELRAREERILRREPWGISAIVLWEIAKLRQLGRIALDPESIGFKRALEAIHIWPIDWQVAKRSTELDIRSDPADEIILATSIIHRAALVTRDARLRRTKLTSIAR